MVGKYILIRTINSDLYYTFGNTVEEVYINCCLEDESFENLVSEFESEVSGEGSLEPIFTSMGGYFDRLEIIDLETGELVLRCYTKDDCRYLFSYFYKFVHKDGYPLYDLFRETFKHLDISSQSTILRKTEIESINQNIIL